MPLMVGKEEVDLKEAQDEFERDKEIIVLKKLGNREDIGFMEGKEEMEVVFDYDDEIECETIFADEDIQKLKIGDVFERKSSGEYYYVINEFEEAEGGWFCADISKTDQVDLDYLLESMESSVDKKNVDDILMKIEYLFNTYSEEVVLLSNDGKVQQKRKTKLVFGFDRNGDLYAWSILDIYDKDIKAILKKDTIIDKDEETCKITNAKYISLFGDRKSRVIYYLEGE